MRHLTEQEIKEIIWLKNKPTPIKEIADKLKVSRKTIYLHINPDYKIKIREYQRRWYHDMSPEKKKEYLARRRDYQREYHKNKYHTDETFRKKQLERSRIAQKNVQKKKKGDASVVAKEGSGTDT